MRQTTGKSQNALFIYIRDESGRFWIYDGAQYHHFFSDDKKFWYVRSQAYLPAYAVGSCLSLNQDERQILEWEAARFGIVLPFFDSEDECNGYALLAQQEQFIFDRTFPAGYFYLNKNMQQRSEDE